MILSKKITGALTIYSINRLLIPKLLYISQIMVLSEADWTNLFTPALKLVKRKLNLPKNFLMTTLYYNNIVGVDNIWKKYCTNISTALLARINTPTGIGIITQKEFTLIRIRTFQLSAKIAIPIWNSVDWNMTSQLLRYAKNNLCAFALLVTLSINIKIVSDQFKQEVWTIKGGLIMLESLVENKADLAMFKAIPPGINSAFSALFLDQFILPSDAAITWQTLAVIRNKLRPGRTAF